MIFGEINDSIIAHRCVVEKGSVVEKSVLLTSTFIEHDCYIKYAIIGDEVIIPAHTEICGSEDHIVLVTKDNLDEILESQNKGE